MKLTQFIFLGATAICLTANSLEAAYTISKGKVFNIDDLATLPIEEHYSLGRKALKEENWKEAIHQFRVVTQNSPQTIFGQNAYYYLGAAYFNHGEYDFANDAFSLYLRLHSNPKCFESAIKFKYTIAERFKMGAKRRLLGTKMLPKWASGTSLALEIYDEIIAAMPCSEIAAQALFSKGHLLWDMNDYKESIESFQLIIRRFPKHELAPTTYVIISKVYLDQSQNEFQNPDILAFAQINSRKFQRDFPKDERLLEVEADVLSIKEIYAKGLFDTGQFYERKQIPVASVIYYQSAIDQFPETDIAKQCEARLSCLCQEEQSTSQSATVGEDFTLESANSQS